MKHSTNWWIGIDDDAKKMNVAIFKDHERAPRQEFVVHFDDRGLGRLERKLKELPGQVRCAYEAGPCGYFLYRSLDEKGICCTVAAPSLTPVKPGDKVKTNKKDARKIADSLRSGNLTPVYVPDVAQEAVRDVVRVREQILKDLGRQQKRLKSFLLRQGRRYDGGKKSWTESYWQWLRSQKFDNPDLRMVFEHYMLAVEISQHQLRLIEQEMEPIAQRKEYADRVQNLTALYGVRQLTALTMVVESVDLRRFESAPGFMDYSGLVTAEDSSGDKQRHYGITKTGNAHLRRVLVETAWHYSRMRGVGKTVLKRREGLPLGVVKIAQKADARLRRKYLRLVRRNKLAIVAVTAVARELAGFVWAIGQQS